MDLNIGPLLATLFVFQIFSLYLFSKLLIQSLGRLFLTLTGSHTKMVHLLALLFLPGTFVHESAHAFVATITLVTVHDFHLFPKVEENGIRLGSVEISRSDPFRRALIGVAPIIMGVISLLTITWLVEYKIPVAWSSWWIYLLLSYATFVISNTMFSSKKDIEGAILTIVLLICLVAALLILKFNQPFILFGDFLNNHAQFLFKLNIYLLVPILIDLIIFSLFKLLKINRY